MADVILRFQLNESGVPDGLANQLGFAATVSLVQPTPIFDLTVPDGTPDGVAVAIEVMAAAGWTKIDEDPATSLDDISRAELFGVSRLYASSTLLTLGTLADGEVVVRDGTDVVGISRKILGSSTAHFGGKMNTAGRYYTAGGESTAGTHAALDEQSESALPAAVTLDRAAWRKEDSGNATLNVLLDGLITETFVASGISGSVALTGEPADAGSVIAVEFDSGTAPGNSTIQVYTGAA